VRLEQKYKIHIFLEQLWPRLVILRAGSCEVVIRVELELNLLLVSVEEPWVIHVTTSVSVARVVAERRVELEGGPVRTANVYTENLFCFAKIADDGYQISGVDQIVNTEVFYWRPSAILACDQIPPAIIAEAGV